MTAIKSKSNMILKLPRLSGRDDEDKEGER